MKLKTFHNVVLIFVISFSFSCKKEETIVRTNNSVPKYDGVSTIMIENYVNRLFIDVLGRESTVFERENLVNRLKLSQLSMGCRDSIIKALQFDTTFRIGDSSYRKAYTTRIYNISKARFLEGAADMDIAQRSSNLGFAMTLYQLNGDSVNMFYARDQKKYYDRILKSNYWLSKNLITYNQLCSYMINNGIYDLINMGSFNFVNATFDDLLNRKPSADEFNRCYQIIEKNIPTDVFNRVVSNKNEYCEAITESLAFNEAEIRWWYYQYLRREIPSSELFQILKAYLKDQSIENVQRTILTTDNYAQF